MRCKRGFGEVLVPEWCPKCEKNNIFKRCCDRLRKDIEALRRENK